MDLNLYKYQAAGNDFIMIDAFKKDVSLTEKQIEFLCDRRFGVGADGVIFLRESDKYDFKMVYHNSDGKEASMCGNGGRSIVRFASDMGLIEGRCHFEAIDGEHSAIIEGEDVKLKMMDVDIPKDITKDLIQTGSPHFVVEVNILPDIDVLRDGRSLRFDKRFAPGGCNVNFIEAVSPEEIHQRTYERGVEDETFACGTGAVAGAVFQAVKHDLQNPEIKVHMKGGTLFVKLQRVENRFVHVWLKGPAHFVFKGQINF